MSAIVASDPVQMPVNIPAAQPLAEKFAIGWREVNRRRPDGATEVVKIPLTPTEALHPMEGDVIVETDVHFFIRTYLALVFKSRLANDPTALVLSDTGVYWGHPEYNNHSPDISVIFGIRQQRQEWPSFEVASEGVRPRLVIEIVSPSTRENDIVTKVKHYHELEVPIYVIVDLVNGQRCLLGYQRTPTKYLAMPTDENGRLWLESVGVWLGIKGDRVACYDGVTGQEIPDYSELTARVAEEKARADAAEQRLRELEAQLSRLASPE